MTECLRLQALLIVGLMCIPISALWWFATAPVLELMQIEPETIALTQLYARTQIACLPPILATTATQQFLQAQGIVKPYTATIASLVLPSVFLYWLFIVHLQLGFAGALLAQVCNAWATFMCLQAAIRCRGLHKQCWHGWSREALTGWGEMLRLGTAGTVHQMAEWWSWEITAGMAGLLGPVQLAAHSCLINFVWLFYMLPWATSLAVTIRVGNLLGEGQPRRARSTFRVGLLINTIMAAVMIAAIAVLRDVFPYLLRAMGNIYVIQFSQFAPDYGSMYDMFIGRSRYVYVTDDAVAAAASDAAPAFLLLFTFDCLNMVIVGALRSV